MSNQAEENLCLSSKEMPHPAQTPLSSDNSWETGRECGLVFGDTAPCSIVMAL